MAVSQPPCSNRDQQPSCVCARVYHVILVCVPIEYARQVRDVLEQSHQLQWLRQCLELAWKHVHRANQRDDGRGIDQVNQLPNREQAQHELLRRYSSEKQT